MTREQEAATELARAIRHVGSGNGPATVRLHGLHGMEDGVVVFVMPGPIGIIIDDALDKLYAQLGWKVAKQGQQEAR